MLHESRPRRRQGPLGSPSPHLTLDVPYRHPPKLPWPPSRTAQKRGVRDVCKNRRPSKVGVDAELPITIVLRVAKSLKSSCRVLLALLGSRGCRGDARSAAILEACPSKGNPRCNRHWMCRFNIHPNGLIFVAVCTAGAAGIAARVDGPAGGKVQAKVAITAIGLNVRLSAPTKYRNSSRLQRCRGCRNLCMQRWPCWRQGPSKGRTRRL